MKEFETQSRTPPNMTRMAPRINDRTSYSPQTQNLPEPLPSPDQRPITNDVKSVNPCN